MAYTTINKSTDYFNTKLYTGTGSSQSITGVGHQPDFVWVKQRSGTQFHQLANVIQGVGKQVCSNADEAESTDANGLTAFGTDGFSVGSSGNYNNNGGTFASWNWKANGAGSANTDGSISSTVSANTTSGFSIVKWTGSGATATIGHGLGSVPKMIIVKNRYVSENWIVYHSTLGSSKHLKLNLTDAEATTGGTWNHTNPTANVFTVHTNTNVNASGNSMMAYCFAEKTGYSKFGSYTGNGNADGTFIYTGFKPAFVMIKKYSTGTTTWWQMTDNKRGSYNQIINPLYANVSDSEYSNTIYAHDFLSNGIKARGTNAGINESGASYIYMAFAEAPLVGSNNVPCTAR